MEKLYSRKSRVLAHKRRSNIIFSTDPALYVGFAIEINDFYHERGLHPHQRKEQYGLLRTQYRTYELGGEKSNYAILKIKWTMRPFIEEEGSREMERVRKFMLSSRYETCFWNV
jgi:hypothetical protein